MPATSKPLSFACRAGALLLLSIMFPDRTSRLMDWLTVPVAAADTAMAAAALLPPGVRAAAQRAKQRAADACDGWGAGLEGAGLRLGWLRGSLGLAHGAWHTVRTLAGAVGMGRQRHHALPAVRATWPAL
jgi:hypothetical protein